MKTVFVHIGLHKTGTTALQDLVFPNLENVHYVKNTGKFYKALQQIEVERNLSDQDIKELRSIMEDRCTGDVNLISYEGLCGQLFYVNRKSRSEIFKNLKSVFQDFRIKIILVIREQSSLIHSLYKQYVLECGTKDEQGFLNDLAGYNEGQFYRVFNYSKLIDELKKIFGKNNIYIAIYEKFNKNRSEFLKQLMEHIGEKRVPSFAHRIVNPSYGSTQIKLARFFNHLFKSPSNPKGLIPVYTLPLLGTMSPKFIFQSRLAYKLLYKEFHMSKRMKLDLKRRYADDNKFINERYNLHLDKTYLTAEP